MPWALAIALGAIVAPPDAAAATAMLRHVKPPHRILTILEGESLLNDASALLIYRLALGGVATNAFSIATVGADIPARRRRQRRRRPRRGVAHAAADAERSTTCRRRSSFNSSRRLACGLLPRRSACPRVLTMVCFAVSVARPASEMHAGPPAHPVVRGVGNRGVRAQRAGVRVHRPADSSDSDGSRSGRTRPLLLGCRRRPPDRHRDPYCLGDDLLRGGPIAQTACPRPCERRARSRPSAAY